MKTLAQLQAEQKAAGLVALRPDDDSPVLGLTGVWPGPVSPTGPVGEVGIAGHRGFPGIAKPADRDVRGHFVGYCKLLGATDLTPGPLCRIEGQPEHPDFSTNLLAPLPKIC